MRRFCGLTPVHMYVAGLSLTLALSLAPSVWAQGRQTGTLRGTAHDETDAVLPGVTVTVTSTVLQGTRFTVSDINGNYEILGLPNGTYLARFELDGFTPVENMATVPLGGTVEVNVIMRVGGVVFAVEVVAFAPAPLASTEISQNITAEEVGVLPMGRNPSQIAELAPGLTDNARNAGQVTIAGSFGYDNIFLIDGVDTSDNIFGTSNDLFIEDAIEESQILTSGISAEYGRFSGGVINVVTKSGGNDFSGSFRVNMNKPDWVGRTPLEEEADIERTGTLADNTTYESTVGGPVVLDRLWFFYANRVQRQSETQTFDQTFIPYQNVVDNDRNQIKFTGTIATGHTLEGSYLRNSTTQTGPSFPFTIDPAGLRARTLPNDLWVATYRGAITPDVFAEFQVSRREFGFRGSGGTSTSIFDSPFITLADEVHYNAPYFDASDPQDRNNRQLTGSATYLRPTGMGTHSFKGGFEHFQSTLRGGGSQSATGYVFDADYAVGPDGSPVYDGNGRLIPTFVPEENLIERWPAVPGATIDINTLSFYVNDTWRVNEHLTVNLGVRTETVNSESTGNIVGIDHSTVVPRLGAAYDPRGDGRYTIQSTYGHYSGKYSEAQFGSNTNVGNPDLLLGVYVGPPGQGLDFAPGFDPDNYVTIFGSFPIGNVFFDEGLHSPITKEFTLSTGLDLGARGYTKVTYVNRRAGDFVEDYLDLTTGSTEIVQDGDTFGPFTNQVYRNTDDLTRDYDAIEVQSRVQVTDDFLVDGTYTLQIRNEGNFEGEVTNSPALSSSAFDYPEITPVARYFPAGRLDEFQRHKLRLWGIYNLAVGRFGRVDIGGIWRVNSGSTYSLESNGVPTTLTQRAILTNLGYPDRPGGRTIFYAAGRGSETFPGYGLFDLSVNYSIPIWESLRPWVKVELYNLFNNSKQIAWNTTVAPDTAGPVDALGIPTNFVEGANFGEATSPNHYPEYLPGLDGLRAFRLAFGFRF